MDTIDRREARKDILDMATPVLIELLMGTLFGMVDMIMLGRYGTDSVAAAGISSVGITNQFIFIGLSLVQAFNAGATAMVARYIGSGRHDRIEDIVRHIILLTQVLLVLPMLFFGLFKTNAAMSFLGANSEMIGIGSGYFRVIAMGFLFQAFNFSIFASLRGAGDTRTPMKVNLFVNLFNAIGNAVLIYGLFGFPELGILGAGISTSVAHIIATVILSILLLRKKNIISIDLKKKFRYDKDIIYNLTKIGIPASLEQIALRAGIIIFNRMVSSLGTEAYATHQIAINILRLSFTPGQAFGIAASTVTGRSLGENNSRLAEEYIKISSRLGAMVSLGMGGVFFFFGTALASLYTNSQTIIIGAGEVLKLIAFIQPFQAIQLIVAGGLRGAGDTIWTLVSSFIGILIIRSILTYVFVNVFFLGLKGAWTAIFIDQFIRCVLIWGRFRTGKWKYVELR